MPITILIEWSILFIVLFYCINLTYLEQDKMHSLMYLFKGHYKAFLILSISWFFIGSYFNIYRFERGRSLAFYLERTFFQLLIFSILLFAVSGLKKDDLLSNPNSIRFLSIFIIAITLFRVILFFSIRKARAKGLNSRNVLLVDHNKNTEKYIATFQSRKELGYRIKGIINGSEIDGINIKNFNLEDFERILEKFRIDVIFLSLEGVLSDSCISEIKLLATKKKVKINYIPSPSMLGYNDLEVGYIYTYPILQGQRNPLDNVYNRCVKRIFDFIISAIALLVLSLTVFPIISILIILDSGFPIFFKQLRKGAEGKEFYCYKFRTMKINLDSDRKITIKGDARITRVGKILRKTSLDELPQLWNVVIGDMSLVGPRPHMLQQDELYDESIAYYSLRHHVKPGITGLAQISGFRGEINTDKDMEDRVRSDIYYIRNWSLSQDVVIIVKTVVKMIVGDENAI